MEATPSQTRDTWGSKMAFILAAAGSAIGLGNIWAFPTNAAANGGAAFLLVYLICVAGVGLPREALTAGEGDAVEGTLEVGDLARVFALVAVPDRGGTHAAFPQPPAVSAPSL